MTAADKNVGATLDQISSSSAEKPTIQALLYNLLFSFNLIHIAGLVLMLLAMVAISPVLDSTSGAALVQSDRQGFMNIAPAPALAESTFAFRAEPLLSGTLLFRASADSRVSESVPTSNYGTGSYLQVDNEIGAHMESYVRFSVTGLSGPIDRAILRVYDTTNASTNGPALYGTDIAWTETAITWNNRPSRTTGMLGNQGNVAQATWVEYDVTGRVTSNGTYSFVLVADSADGLTFSSREGSQPPELMITTAAEVLPTPTAMVTPTSTSTSTNTVTLVGAGDISSCNNDNDELTAQLLDNIPGTIFNVGDNAYNEGTYTQYSNCYDPTWGRHKSRTRPVPGNHEYYISSDASGYFEYFENVPNYYAYNLGAWRIYALNSEIDVSATSAQVKWLKADLAANPHLCVLAYWHKPRWSSGTRHGDGSLFQTLWQALAESGAELVINGHEHNYERFTQMNRWGQPVTKGMRAIVVGTGGVGHHDLPDTLLSTSQAHNDTTYGVLKLTLRPTGYDWKFVPVVGSSFTDGGSTACH